MRTDVKPNGEKVLTNFVKQGISILIFYAFAMQVYLYHCSSLQREPNLEMDGNTIGVYVWFSYILFL